MTRNALLFVVASVAVLFLWFRLVDRYAPLPVAPTSAQVVVASAHVASPAVTEASSPAISIPVPGHRAAHRVREQTVRLDNGVLDATLSNQGACFVSLKLKGVRSMLATGTRNSDQDLIPLSGAPRYGALSLSGTNLDGMDWTVLTPSPERSASGVSLVRFGAHVPGTSLDFVKTFTFKPGVREVGIDISIHNSGPKTQALLSPLSLVWGPDLGGDGGGLGRVVHSGVVQLSDRVERDDAGKDQKVLDFESPRWVALKNHYFVAAYFPQKGSPWTRAELDDLGAEHMNAALQAENLSVAPGKTVSLDARLWVGPQDYDLLKSVGDNFDSVLQFQDWSVFSWLNPLCIWLLRILGWFYMLTGNWGVAIILLTLLVRGALFYPSMKSMVSMRHMQSKQKVLKPRLETLKKTYKDNPKKLNEETMKLYKEFGVNPLGGCLPMLVQIPIFFSLYDTLAAAYELRGAGFCWRWTDLAAGDPTYIFPIAMGVS
ncbi:MAG: membrane protein insertase YidC, partial [bacterium]